jgi:hypothetical protein
MGPCRAGALSLYEGMFVEIDGVLQRVTIRGSSLHNHVLLILHGTGYALSPMALLFAPLGDEFHISTWRWRHSPS